MSLPMPPSGTVIGVFSTESIQTDGPSLIVNRSAVPEIGVRVVVGTDDALGSEYPVVQRKFVMSRLVILEVCAAFVPIYTELLSSPKYAFEYSVESVYVLLPFT